MVKKQPFIDYQDNTEDPIFENQTLIGSALGGKNNMIRYCVVLSGITNTSFSQEQTAQIKAIISRIAQDTHSELEGISFGKYWVVLDILISVERPVGEVIESSIKACNDQKEILAPDYYVTNVSRPSNRQILRFIKEVVKTVN